MRTMVLPRTPIKGSRDRFNSRGIVLGFFFTTCESVTLKGNAIRLGFSDAPRKHASSFDRRDGFCKVAGARDAIVNTT